MVLCQNGFIFPQTLSDHRTVQVNRAFRQLAFERSWWDVALFVPTQEIPNLGT